MSSLLANKYKGLEIQPQFARLKLSRRLIVLLRKQTKINREIERLTKAINKKDQ